MSESTRADELREEERDFPLRGLTRALPHFRRPFEPAAVRWKVQSVTSRGGIVIAYIDARLVIERMNLVVGDGWEDAYKPYAQGVEECALSVFGVTRHDVGTGSGPQAAKGTRSDALKRTAVKFGIGVSIYALKSVQMGATPEWEADPPKRLLIAHSSYKKGDKTIWSARMSPAAEKWLSEMYAKWLKRSGEELFGPPLGHGDEVGAQGFELEEGARVPEAVEPGEEVASAPVLDDDLALDLRNRVARAYGAIRKINAATITPAAHAAAVADAAGSHEALEALAVKREAKLAEMQGVST